MEPTYWNEKAKCLLKSELVRRGITNEMLVQLLAELGVIETKASVDSKISRGTFSAAFLLQCLNAINCKSFVCEIESFQMAVAEPAALYAISNNKNKKSIK